MTAEPTLDPSTKLLAASVQQLLDRRHTLRKELDQVNQTLTKHVADVKTYMATQGYKKVAVQGWQFTYTYPHKYYTLNRPTKDLAIDFPELVDEKIGYERLIIRRAKSIEASFQELESFEREEQKEGLQYRVQLAREMEGDYSEEEDDDEQAI